MNEFLSASFAFPTILFSAALVVVAGFWLLVLLGAAEHDAFDGDVGSGPAAGLAGVPVAVAASLLIVTGWFVSLAGAVPLRRSGLTGGAYAALACGLLIAAALAAWVVTRGLLHPLAKLFPDERAPSRQDFIGLTCTIRTGRVDTAFGQAEVAAEDGTTALVQVRLAEHDLRKDPTGLTAGSTGLLYAYDEDGEFFWVAPYGSLESAA
ncbi:hypothetical protein [Streptomyces sp. MUM 178J]|uniref:hypothetical protein n=1 Tax=Streptomyces sp. MUM 178J TaxID=2791991 RepID=UPI001F04EA8A|nr:hypothetical protein [Streptomyces sp. MUM 178J]WRQ82234.1 hypothetical protein I3F59_024350 [Streptomyces sp. MUM 178J]